MKEISIVSAGLIWEMYWFSISTSYILEIIFGLWRDCDGEIPMYRRWQSEESHRSFEH